MVKSRYSGFANTALDTELKAGGIQYLLFTGIATNVCVETTLRHAFVLDYWPIRIADAVMAAGSPAMQEATLFNVETYFGWTISANEFIEKVACVAPSITVAARSQGSYGEHKNQLRNEKTMNRNVAIAPRPDNWR